MWELQNQKNAVNNSLDEGRYEDAMDTLSRWRQLIPVFEPLLRARLAIYRRLGNRDAFAQLTKILNTRFPDHLTWQAAMAEAKAQPEAEQKNNQGTIQVFPQGRLKLSES